MWKKKQRNVFFKEKINGYLLDKEQQKAIMTKGNVQLIASAGSGKTLTIVGKVKYLIEIEHIKEENILCISFTRKSKESLENAINKEKTRKVQVKTFHQLALDILNHEVRIAPSDLLEYCVYEIFDSTLGLEELSPYLDCYFNLTHLEKNSKNIYLLKSLIVTFIHLFKTNNYRKEDFKDLFQKAKKDKVKILLLYFIYYCYTYYMEELQSMGMNDFDDFISMAIQKVRKKETSISYSHIIIDEFQDTSFLRLELILSLMKKDASILFVVGDDYQSIYRFTGCDISLFLHLKRFVPNLTIRKIQTTYRFSYEMGKVSTRWMKKNRHQMRKKIHSNKRNPHPIEIVYEQNRTKDFKKFLLFLWNHNQTDILVLGRNQKDIFSYLDDTWNYEKNEVTLKDNPSIHFTYLTVHKAKGLEAEIVIVLNVIQDILGFPNQIKDHEILSLLAISESLVEEERRLFYVAITRAKKKTYLFTEKKKESFFLLDLQKENKKYVKKFIFPCFFL